MLGNLGWQIVAIADCAALILCPLGGEVRIAVGLAQAVEQPPGGGGVLSEGEHPQFGVGAQLQGQRAQQRPGQGAPPFVQRLLQIDQIQSPGGNAIVGDRAQIAIEFRPGIGSIRKQEQSCNEGQDENWRNQDE